MQIWKSANIFVFIWKEYVEDFTFEHLLLFELCAHDINSQTVYNNMLKISQLFNKFTNFTGK